MPPAPPLWQLPDVHKKENSPSEDHWTTLLCPPAFAFQSNDWIDLLSLINPKVLVIRWNFTWTHRGVKPIASWDAALTFPPAVHVAKGDGKSTWLEKAWQSHVQIQRFFHKPFDSFINIFNKMFPSLLLVYISVIELTPTVSNINWYFISYSYSGGHSGHTCRNFD